MRRTLAIAVAAFAFVCVGCGEGAGEAPETAQGNSDRGNGLTPGSARWDECVERFGRNACREGVGSYGGPLDDSSSGAPSDESLPQSRHGEYTCYGRSIIADVDEADADVVEAEEPRDAANVEYRDGIRRVEELDDELEKLDKNQSPEGIAAYNAKVDEYNAALEEATRAERRLNTLVRRVNRLIRRYNRLLDEECVKD